MPAEREEGPSVLPADIQERMDAVRAGSSTDLSLWSYKGTQLTEIPQEVRELTGLRSLSLVSRSLATIADYSTPISTLPPWLNELPNLESVDLIGAKDITFPSSLPNVRWHVDAEQILNAGDLLDPATISTISIRPGMTRNAIQHVFDLGRSGALKISDLYISSPPGAGARE